MYDNGKAMHGMGAGDLGNYVAPAHKATTIRGSFMRKEGSGVQYGLSSYKSFDSEEASAIGIDYTRDPMTGNATERVHTNPTVTKGSEKGHTFEIC